MASTNRDEDVVCLACLPSLPLIRVDTPGYVLVNETSVSLRHKIDSRRPRFPGLGNAVPLCPPSENRLDHWVGTLHAVDMTAGRVRVRIMNGWYLVERKMGTLIFFLGEFSCFNLQSILTPC